MGFDARECNSPLRRTLYDLAEGRVFHNGPNYKRWLEACAAVNLKTFDDFIGYNREYGIEPRERMVGLAISNPTLHAEYSKRGGDRTQQLVREGKIPSSEWIELYCD